LTLYDSLMQEYISQESAGDKPGIVLLLLFDRDNSIVPWSVILALVLFSMASYIQGILFSPNLHVLYVMLRHYDTLVTPS